MVSFEYELTTDDFVAFNQHFLMTSELGQRQRRFYRSILVTTTGIASAIVAGGILESLSWGVSAGIVGAVVMWSVSPNLWRREIRRNIRRMAKGDGIGTPGRYVLTLDDDAVREDTPSSTTTTPWRSLIRFDETADHLFIYTGPVAGVIVPKRVGEHQISELRSVLAEHMNRA